MLRGCIFSEPPCSANQNYFIIALVDGDGDHHDNMFRRLQLLPQTRRGNIIRKMMAHQSLQIILKTNNDKSVTSIPHADRDEYFYLLQLCINIAE